MTIHPRRSERKLTVAGEELVVVPNRMLEDYLQDKIDQLLEEIDINLEQAIDADVPSDDDIYIGRVRVKPAASGLKPAAGEEPVALDDLLKESIKAPHHGNSFESSDPKGIVADAVAKSPTRPKAKPRRRPQTEGRLAAAMVRETLQPVAPGRGVLESRKIPKRTQRSLIEQITARLPTDVVTHFESETGFAVHGAQVKRVAPVQGPARAELLDSGASDGRPALFRVWDAAPTLSVGVEFEDGRSSVFAAIRGYIGHCTVTSAGLSNVSYVPSNNTWRWGEYVGRRELVDKLRAEIAVAADHNTFSLSSPEKAARFAQLIRSQKAFDPTLGLYAAYAYSQADDEAEIRSVLQFMRGDIGADLFDVRMLAFRRPPAAGSTDATAPVVPACPMLTQGWNLLGPRQIKLPAVLAEGARHLTGSLWTTFAPPFAGMLFAAFEHGDL